MFAMIKNNTGRIFVLTKLLKMNPLKKLDAQLHMDLTNLKFAITGMMLMLLIKFTMIKERSTGMILTQLKNA